MKKFKVLALILVLLTGVLAGCKNSGKGDGPTSTPVLTPTEAAKATETPAPTEEVKEPDTSADVPSIVANTVYDAYDEFDTVSPTGENGPWIYSFTSDSGATFDPLTILEAGNGLTPWHPWGGNWTGVGLNGDVVNYVELNTDGKDGFYGTLGFRAPADGNYGIAGSAYNPWSQPADKVYCVVNGNQLFAAELGSSDTGALLFPYTTVSLKAGDEVYFYCPSTEEDSWVSAYLKVKIAYEPTEQPEIFVEEAVQTPVIVFEAPEGAYNCVAEFDTESSTGENGVWVYSYTNDEGESFEFCEILEPFDDFVPWHPWSGEYTGVGTNPGVEDRLELNTNGLGGIYGALGFKAPQNGIYTITGVVGNPWNQTADVLHARLNGEDLFTVLPGGSDTGDAYLPETTVTLNEGDIIYFYCPSTVEGSWVSAYVAVAVLLVE